jgi:hypothetical protein
MWQHMLLLLTRRCFCCSVRCRTLLARTCGADWQRQRTDALGCCSSNSSLLLLQHGFCCWQEALQVQAASTCTRQQRQRCHRLLQQGHCLQAGCCCLLAIPISCI